MYKLFQGLSRRQKQVILIVLDAMVAFAVTGLVCVLSGITLGTSSIALMSAAAMIGGGLAYLVGTCNVVLHALNTRSLERTMLHGLLLGMLVFGVSHITITQISLLDGLVIAALFIAGAISARIAAVTLLETLRRNAINHTGVLIYGAGSAGQQLFASLQASNEARPVAFVDDNPSLHGAVIGGVKVHSPNRLPEIIARTGVEQILLAIPSISRGRRAAIIEALGETGCSVMELPPYNELLTKRSMVESLREVKMDELLGRDVVELDLPEMRACYGDKTVMISGAGGSIGSELCRKVLEAGPRKLVLYELCEYALYAIDMELRGHPNAADVEIVPLLGSVCDQGRVTFAIEEHGVNIVLHAAAYKHVPLVEGNPIEAAQNNVLGTQVLARAAVAAHVERFILVSTDKAVRPTNVMGATKRLAELVIQDLQTRSEHTILSMVRFGNVLGSSGSVIPLFKRQIEEGGPVTVTDPEVTRYFMTIPEAAKLVLLAGSYASGGEVFVLEMGEPVKIAKLARRLIEISGLDVRDESNPDGDIEIVYTGLRPGEKLYEELLIGSNTVATPYEKILCAVEGMKSQIEVAEALRTIARAKAQNNPAVLRTMLESMVDGFGAPAQAKRRNIAS